MKLPCGSRGYHSSPSTFLVVLKNDENHKKQWINVCFWETARPPLPKPNIITSRKMLGLGKGVVGSFSDT